ILANGRAGAVDGAAFQAALTAGCIEMAQQIARDGEGATKLLRVTVRGAAGDRDARTVAKSLVNSPLIKTMAYGADPNVGRILMAIGKCFDSTIDREATRVLINGAVVIERGERAAFEDADVRR